MPSQKLPLLDSIADAQRRVRVRRRERDDAARVDAQADGVVVHVENAGLVVAAVGIELLGDLEAQRHVVALHQRARIDGRELEQDRFAVAP